MGRTPGTRRKVHIEPRSLPPERPGPEGGVRDATRRARTTALATAALRLFLERGVEAVTIDEIASRASLAKGTFYTYFRDKADVVEALLAPVTAQVLGAFERCEAALRDVHDPPSLLLAYQALAAALASTLVEHQGVVLLYLQESRMPAVGARAPVALFAREVRARAVVLTLEARTHGLLRALDARVTANAVVGAVETLVFLALSGEDLGSPEEASAALIELMLHGVATAV